MLVKPNYLFYRWNRGPERASGCQKSASQLLVQSSPLSSAMHLSLKLFLYLFCDKERKCQPKNSFDGKRHGGWGVGVVGRMCSGFPSSEQAPCPPGGVSRVGASEWHQVIQWLSKTQGKTDHWERNAERNDHSLQNTALIKTTKIHLREENESLPL